MERRLAAILTTEVVGYSRLIRADEDGTLSALKVLRADLIRPKITERWNGAERKALQARADADAVLALAFEHHLAIGRNIPLDQVVGWITGLAPQGVIEFVQKTDPTVQRMLALRQDIFDAYDERNFVVALERHARIVSCETVSAAGRKLFQYDRA